VRIVIDLPADHQFSNSLKEEIKEKIETLWDIKKVVVEFTA
jgi:nitrogen fixation NifU-like protein